jgi:hypothetical protein
LPHLCAVSAPVSSIHSSFPGQSPARGDWPGDCFLLHNVDKTERLCYYLFGVSVSE